MKTILGIVLFLTTLSTYTQEVNNILYPSIGFEHPQHLDIYVSVVKCNNLPTILITTFNESSEGENIEIGFKIKIVDTNGESEIFSIPKRIYKFGKMEIESCNDSVNPKRSILDWERDNSTKKITVIFDYED